MTVHVDTSFLIEALNNGTPAEQALFKWLGSGAKMAACSVTWAEFLCGPLRAEQMKIASTTIRTQVLFLTEHCALAAELFNATGRRRGSLADCMIAAVAIKSQAPLATSNLADFRKFARHGLVLAQW